jgi:hypothetical protein
VAAQGAGAEHLDRGGTAADDVVLETDPDGLDLGELGHVSWG